MANHCLLYYITDRSQFRGDESVQRGALLAKIAEAARAGVDYIQLRERDLSARELETLARDALTVVRHSSALRTENPEPRTGPEPRTRLLVNSRTDVALATGADGVHLRSNDVVAHEVRQVLEVADRPREADPFLVAASCHTVADVQRSESEKVDFAVFAPVFGKRGAATSPAGLAALHEACQAKIPVFALGGVAVENAASCLKAGAAGLAGIRLFQENKIENVVRALRSL
jgi:thiamine-phosphate pyrophosphorylase